MSCIIIKMVARRVDRTIIFRIAQLGWRMTETAASSDVIVDGLGHGFVI
jgi:hypothetical protein